MRSLTGLPELAIALGKLAFEIVVERFRRPGPAGIEGSPPGEQGKRQERALEVERRRVVHRDADQQDLAYEYACEGHPNKTLALRYGIANQRRSGRLWEECNAIRARKLERVSDEQFLAELPDFGNRRVRVVIESGTEYVKTFLPLSDSWFQQHGELELVLKDNPTFSLKELATIHVQKTVLNADRPPVTDD